MFQIDTDILIYIARKKLKSSLLQFDGTETISDITYMEMVQGCRDKEELRKWITLSKKLKLISINEAISERARYLVETYALSHNLCLQDALIASTAISYGLTLMTCNRKHYHFIPGLQTRFVMVPA